VGTRRPTEVNLCLFFEGTGQGVAGRFTNVTRLRDLCAASPHQKLHLEAGPGTHFGAYVGGKVIGSDWRAIFRSSRRWFEANYQSLPPDASGTSVFLFGFSRGALLARHFASWLDKLGIGVEYLGLWDTVDATAGLDVQETCPENVKKARHAVARDETRRFFAYVPIRGEKKRVVEMLFPGSHSDVGGLYDDNHLMADLALAWIAAGAKRAGAKLKCGAPIAQGRIDVKRAVLHDSHMLVSNLWGAFDRVKRNFKGLVLHWRCRGIYGDGDKCGEKTR